MPTLAQLRERAMFSQGELAKRCGVAPNTVYFWESGRSLPRLNHQRVLVEVLGCTPDELLAAMKETKEARERREREEGERPAA